jgi:hypothetical protein
MKEAMFKTGKTGQYQFSDYDFRQKILLDYSKELWQKSCAEMIYEHFKHGVHQVEEIENWVILETPYIWRSGILKILENEGKIISVTGRCRQFTYPKKASIKFE